MRDDAVTTRTITATCRYCATTFPRSGRRVFCSAACRQADYRARRRQPAAPARTRATSVYACPHCDQRLLGEQRCPDCNVFARRLGAGGPCPHCGEPVAAEELLA